MLRSFDAIRGESKVVSYSMVHAMVELGGSPMLARLLPLFGKTTYGEMTLQEYQSMMAIMAVSKGPVAHYKCQSAGHSQEIRHQHGCWILWCRMQTGPVARSNSTRTCTVCAAHA